MHLRSHAFARKNTPKMNIILHRIDMAARRTISGKPVNCSDAKVLLDQSDRKSETGKRCEVGNHIYAAAAPATVSCFGNVRFFLTARILLCVPPSHWRNPLGRRTQCNEPGDRPWLRAHIPGAFLKHARREQACVYRSGIFVLILRRRYFSISSKCVY